MDAKDFALININEIIALANDGKYVKSQSTIRFLFEEIERYANKLNENMEWLSLDKDDKEG